MELTYDDAILERVTRMEKHYFNGIVLNMLRIRQQTATAGINRLPFRVNSNVGKVYGGVESLREMWKKERAARGEKLSVEELARMEGALTGYLAGKNGCDRSFDFLAVIDGKRRELHVDEAWKHVFEIHYVPAFRKALQASKKGNVRQAAICRALMDAEEELYPVSPEEAKMINDMATVLAEALA